MNIQNRNPKISIIIAVYNGSDTMQACIDSVIGQKYTNKELIIIDGGSDDGTIELIRSYDNYIAYWVSEPDRGIYDAWNKGLERSSGEWICFLGSDDSLATCETLSKMVNILIQDKTIDFLSGKARLFNKDGKLKRIKGLPWQWSQFKRFMGVIVHPGALHCIRLFNYYGKFDTNYQIAGDYEFLLRAGPELNAKFIPEIVVNMSISGSSSRFPFKTCYEAFIIQKKSKYIGLFDAYINLIFILIKYYAGKIKYDLFWFLLKNSEQEK
ncbi:MAG: glycosyltransferase family 2 protein [Anaerolineales bacterium]